MSPISILVEDKQSRSRAALSSVKSKARSILEILGCDDCELSMLLVDDELMARLNEQFRGVQGPTDVLSFPQGPAPFGEIRPVLLGDVVVSTESAQRQADEMGRSLEEEMDLLLTHGILHLLGYDHETSRSDAGKMKVREAEVLNALKSG